MHKMILFTLFFASLMSAQISSYLESSPQGECAPVIIIAPEIKAKMLGGDFESEELTNASNMLASAVSNNYKKSKIIQKTDLESIKNCNSNVVVVKLINYYKEPARMGQFRGHISVEILFFPSPHHPEPTNKYKFNAKGGVHWGDSTPFFNAIGAVSKKIKRGF